MKADSLEDSMVGCLLGTEVGDAAGLACEGYPKRRQRAVFGEITGPRLLFGRGMMSDDTEHTCMTAQALIVSGGDAAMFTRSLARQLRVWLMLLPAGTGLATLKACCRLWLGFGPERSGVYSAGNGPAMRAAIIGVCHGGDMGKLRDIVRASTRITHTDPKAEWGALAIALAAHAARTQPDIAPAEFCRMLNDALRDVSIEASVSLSPEARELISLIEQAAESAQAGQSAQQFAARIGLEWGISGYVYHTVPVALQAWLCHRSDLRAAVLDVVHCGGDTDSTAAIVGGIIGAGGGRNAVPHDWLDALWEWPRSVAWMEQLGRRLAQVCAEGKEQRALPLSVSGLLARNMFFLALVLLHGFRRLLPPY